MQIINYYSLEDIEEVAQEHGVEITKTDYSHSFRLFKGRNCTALHICHLANVKEKPKLRPTQEVITSAAPQPLLKDNATGFTYNDGGRAKAGYKGDVGDCVCRAICIVTGLPYKAVYNYLAEHTGKQRRGKGQPKKRVRTAAMGITTKRKWFDDYMKSLGLVWVPTMLVGQGCKVHLLASELPKGRLIVNVSRHFTTMIDGVINDTYDCSREGKRCVYGYYYLA